MNDMVNFNNYLPDLKLFLSEVIENEGLKVEIVNIHHISIYNDDYLISLISERYDDRILLVKGFVGSESKLVNIYPLYEEVVKRSLNISENLASIKDPKRRELFRISESLAILFKEFKRSSMNSPTKTK